MPTSGSQQTARRVDRMKPSTRMSAAAMRVTDVTDELAPGPRAAFKRINNCTSVTSCHSHANVLVHEQQESCRRNITNNARGPSRAMQDHGQAMRVQAVIRRMLAVRSEECPQVEQMPNCPSDIMVWRQGHNEQPAGPPPNPTA